MSEKTWVPPSKIEEIYSKTAGNKFASINKPTAGARYEKELEVGSAPYQLYSIATPNGQKVGIALCELGLDFDEHVIQLSGDQFSSGFTAVNPNGKIPALVDRSDPKNPINLFESGGILMYLAEKHGKFIPRVQSNKPKERAEVINWVMWQMGTGPYFGQFGHFFCYAPKDKIEAIDYGVARYGMEVQRCLDLLEKQLGKNKETSGFISSWGYSIADMAIYPWVRCLSGGYKAGDFLSLDKYEHVNEWMQRMSERSGVQNGMKVTPFQKL